MTSNKREKAIKYLTEEIRSLRMAPQINGCGPENWEEQLEIMETCMEAVKEHFPDTTKMIPLTVAQLRGMDGQPAYWLEDKSWGIISVDRAGPWAGIPFFRGRAEGVNFEYDIESREMEVYAYPSSRIDREAWTAEWVYPENEWNLPKCSKCGCNSKDAQYGHKDNFCPKCGRAMTTEAWAELEKRLRG